MEEAVDFPELNRLVLSDLAVPTEGLSLTETGFELSDAIGPRF